MHSNSKAIRLHHWSVQFQLNHSFRFRLRVKDTPMIKNKYKYKDRHVRAVTFVASVVAVRWAHQNVSSECIHQFHHKTFNLKWINCEFHNLHAQLPIRIDFRNTSFRLCETIAVYRIWITLKKLLAIKCEWNVAAPLDALTWPAYFPSHSFLFCFGKCQMPNTIFVGN